MTQFEKEFDETFNVDSHEIARENAAIKVVDRQIRQMMDIKNWRIGILKWFDARKGPNGLGYVVTNDFGFERWNKRGSDFVELPITNVCCSGKVPHERSFVVFCVDRDKHIGVLRLMEFDVFDFKIALRYLANRQSIIRGVSNKSKSEWRCDVHILSAFLQHINKTEETLAQVREWIGSYLGQLSEKDRSSTITVWLADTWFAKRFREWFPEVANRPSIISALEDSAMITTRIPDEHKTDSKESRSILDKRGEGDAIVPLIRSDSFLSKDDAMNTNNDNLYTEKLFKKAADSFLQTLAKIKDNPARTKRRLIWELIQNAKDVKNRFGAVSIRIVLKDNELEFFHNGDAFTRDDLIGLIQQVSSKDSQNADADQTGKFGTGFISTYLLSTKIYVSGIAGSNDKYRRFKIVLDRSTDRSEDLAKVFISDGKIFNQVFMDVERDPNVDIDEIKEEELPTCFRYPLETDLKVRYAREGIDDLINTLPITLINQPKIKSVEIVYDGRNIRYSCVRNALEMHEGINQDAVCVSENGNVKMCHFLSYYTAGIRLTIPISEEENRLLLQKDNVPKLLRDFPLIGSEKFYFPYYLNGERFEPTEDRNGLLLNGAIEGNKPAARNREILKRAIESAIEFNDLLIQRGCLCRWLLARSRKPEADMQEDTPAWFEGLQTEWRQKLLLQQLVQTEPCKSYVVTSELCLPFFVSSTVSPGESDFCFYNIVREGRFPLRKVCAKIPTRETYREWVDIIERERKTWGEIKFEYFAKDLLQELATLKTISALMAYSKLSYENALEWLLKLINLIFECEDLSRQALIDCPIIPNQAGRFCPLNELSTDYSDEIPDPIRQIFNECVTDESKLEERLIEPSIYKGKIVGKIRSFGMRELVPEVKSIWDHNEDIAKKTVPLVLKLIPKGTTIERKRRDDVVDFAVFMKDFDSNDTLDLDIESNTTNLWKNADVLWAKWTILNIESSKDLQTLQTRTNSAYDTIEYLTKLLCHFEHNQEYYDISNFRDHSIFPCQDGRFRKLLVDSNVYIDEGIPEEIKDLYFACRKKDIRMILLDCKMERFQGVRGISIKDVSDAICKSMKEDIDGKPLSSSESLTIALSILSVLPEGNSDYVKIHQYAKDVFCDQVPSFNEIRCNEFDWRPAIDLILLNIIRRISEAGSLEGLKQKFTILHDKSDCEIIKWLDVFGEILSVVDSGYFRKYLEDDKCRIFVNQNFDLCAKSEVYNDTDLVEYDELKELVSLPPLNYDVRIRLLHPESIMCKFLQGGPDNFKTLTEKIDDLFANYREMKLNPEEESFKKLIFCLNEMCHKDVKLEKALPNYKRKKDALLSRSLGDEKMGMLYRLDQILPEGILEQLMSSSDDGDMLLKRLTVLLNEKGGEKLNITQNVINGTNVVVPSVSRMATISLSDGQYAGLSREDQIRTNKETIAFVKHKLSEEGFDFTKSKEVICGIDGAVDSQGRECPLVIHSNKKNAAVLFLSAADIQRLTKPNALLVVRVDGDRLIKKTLLQLIEGRDRLDLSFSVTNLNRHDRLEQFSQCLRWFNGLRFKFDVLCGDGGIAQFYDCPANDIPDSERESELTADAVEGVF